MNRSPDPTPPTTGAPPWRRSRAPVAWASVIGASATLASVVGLAVSTTSASATSIAVTTTDDSGPGSLRAAIDEANTTPGPDEIDLAPGTYTLSIARSGGNDNSTGDLNVNGDLTIVGTGGAGATTIDA